MAFSNAYTFGFATAVCVVCSLSVASLSLGLKDIQDDNRRRDLQGNILAALGVIEHPKAVAGEEIDKLWTERVEFRVVRPDGAMVKAAEGDLDGDGDMDQDDCNVARKAVKGTDDTPALNSLYVRKDGTDEGAYAVPMYGNGLWGPISGYLALNPAATEVTGVTFFAPKETPGLGAEITKDKFKNQWTGKKVVDTTGAKKAIRVVKGKSENLCRGTTDWCVDGVSGATITSRGVDAMVAQSLTWYDPYLTQLRGR